MEKRIDEINDILNDCIKLIGVKQKIQGSEQLLAPPKPTQQQYLKCTDMGSYHKLIVTYPNDVINMLLNHRTSSSGTTTWYNTGKCNNDYLLCAVNRCKILGSGLNSSTYKYNDDEVLKTLRFDNDPGKKESWLYSPVNAELYISSLWNLIRPKECPHFVRMHNIAVCPGFQTKSVMNTRFYQNEIDNILDGRSKYSNVNQLFNLKAQ